MAKALVVDRASCSAMMMELAQSETKLAGSLYARLAGAWGMRPDRQRITVEVNSEERDLLGRLDLPAGILQNGVLRYGWLVTYRHPKRPSVEVVVFTTDKPPRRRTFRVAGGKQRLVAVKARRIHPTKEAVVQMARTRAKSKKAVEEDELDELEALEELEDLDEDEDVDDEEPEDEEEDEEEEPAPKRRGGKAKAKPAAKRTRRKPAPVEDDDDEEEDEEDEDEDEEPAPKRRTKAAASKTKAAAKSTSKTKPAAKKGAAKRTPPAPRELPAGRLSPADVAELADVDARTVRIFLRANEDEFPKPDGEFRYSFSKSEANKLAKAIKRHRAE